MVSLSNGLRLLGSLIIASTLCQTCSSSQSAYTEEEYAARLEHYRSRIPYKLLKMRYASFTRYFGHLKRLGWVEETGKTEPSAIQDDYPPAPSRVFYRITDAGRTVTAEEVFQGGSGC